MHVHKCAYVYICTYTYAHMYIYVHIHINIYGRIVSFSRSNYILRPSSNGRLGRTRAGDVSSSTVAIYEYCTAHHSTVTPLNDYTVTPVFECFQLYSGCLPITRAKDVSNSEMAVYEDSALDTKKFRRSVPFYRRPA